MDDVNTNLAYQEESWDELIGGRIVAMSPRPTVTHHAITDNVRALFRSYLKGKTCRGFGDGVDLYLSEEDRFVPDGMVVCDRNKIKMNGVHGAPDLVVEVISPSSARYDRGKKMRAYETAGVREYWLISPEGRSVEQYVLEDGRFELREFCALLTEEMPEPITKEARPEPPVKFLCAVFGDLEIALQDIFEDLP